MKSKTATNWSSQLSTNWAMLMVPVGLVFKAVAYRLHNEDPENESHCVFCGRSICDGSGVCLADLRKAHYETNGHPHP